MRTKLTLVVVALLLVTMPLLASVRFISDVVAFSMPSDTGPDISIEAPDPAKFKLSKLTIEPTEVQVGEPVKIRVEVLNEGEEEATDIVTFKINGAVEHTRTVNLLGTKSYAKGKATLIYLITTKDKPGAYQVEVDGLSGSFTVLGIAQPAIWWKVWLGVGLFVIVALLVAWQLKRRRLRTGS